MTGAAVRGLSETDEMGRCSGGAGRVVLGLAGVAAAGAVGALVVFRTRPPALIGALRRSNRAVLNPAMRLVAGRRGAYASLVHHVGRRSGRPYATPVLAERAGTHVYVPLPYGRDVDWCANVLAADRAVIERKGVRLAATAPAIVPASEGASAVRPLSRFLLDLAGVGDYLRLEVEDDGGAPRLSR